MNIHEYSILHPVPLSLLTGKKLIICRATSVATHPLVGGREGRRKAPEETAGRCALYISRRRACASGTNSVSQRQARRNRHRSRKSARTRGATLRVLCIGAVTREIPRT